MKNEKKKKRFHYLGGYDQRYNEILVFITMSTLY